MTAMHPTILLFDIDGTLITTGGVGRRALVKTFEALYGRPDACSSFSFSGMTDRAIARQALVAISIEPTEASIAAVLTRYLELLSVEVKQSDRAKYRVHPGMAEAVNAGLAASMAVGLGTGNIREGAMTKLRQVELHHLFRFGGFGDDHELRPELIRRGAQRGAEHLGVALEEARVVVIGDTPKDVSAAQAIGALSLGVGTGEYTAAQLLEHGATWAFDSIAAPGAIELMLTGKPAR